MSLKNRAGEKARARQLAASLRRCRASILADDRGRRPGAPEPRTLREQAEELGLTWPAPPLTDEKISDLIAEVETFAALAGR